MTQPSALHSLSSGEPLFEDVFLGGFECSCHRLQDGRRLDLLSSTRHVELVDLDYARLRAVGMTACRDGVSWIHSTRAPNDFDFSRVKRMVRAARAHDIDVVWDLMHFGWPDDVDVFAPSFPRRFARYARAFARWLASESDLRPFFAPINEMSFLAWAGGDVGCMNPFELARGVELKAQLVRATIEAIEALRDVFPAARFLAPDPIIHIVASPEHPKTWRRVEADNLLQYQAWDMLRGDVFPSLGGDPKYLDVIGVNFYPENQFMLDGTTVYRDDVRFRPLSKMLLDVWTRYRRPMIVSETGSEGDLRARWLRYVCLQSAVALRQGCELHGITLYPVVSHPGWVDDRHCENGLWDFADAHGRRETHEPLRREIERQRAVLIDTRAQMLDRKP